METGEETQNNSFESAVLHHFEEGINPAQSSADAAANPTIVDTIARAIERFVFLKNKRLYRLIALWVIATYLSADFEYMGYLFAYSPEKRSGKSRLLEVLDLLVYKSSGVLVQPTPAILFRTAQDATQLLDEVDTWQNSDELRGILNAGYNNGAVVQRMEKGDEGKYQTIEFSCFCPRALAGIGLDILAPATRDRAFAILMVRQLKGERRERLLRKQRAELESLKEPIAKWAIENKQPVLEEYAQDVPEELDAFSDRTIDIAHPLFAIHSAMYKKHPERAIAADELIEAIAITRHEEDVAGSGGRDVIAELVRAAKKESPLLGSASELAELCTGLSSHPNEYTVASSLRKFGFESKSIRKGGEPRYRYSLKREELEEVLERYGSEQVQ